VAKQLDWIKKCAALLKVPDEPSEGNGVAFPDLMDEANMLEWAGVSFGKGDTYRLYLAMKKLSESLPGEVGRVRLFGKITTRGAPYFVVEGVTPEEQEGVEETKQEGKSGGNKYSYWVTQSADASSGWTKLPNVTMAQVVTARKFKRLLTGNLGAPVPAYPPFPGNEANLLRAQIARIAGATLISPDGYFELDDEGEVKMAEAEALNDRFPKSPAELKEPDAWKHHEVELNKLGRVRAMPEQMDENGEPIVPEEEVEITPPLNAITPESWTFRVGPGGAGASGVSCVTARSLIWPGAVAVAAGRRFLNVYVGNAVAYDPFPYSPPMIGDISSEWKPAEEEAPMIEQPDVRADPTPPKPEGEPEE